MQLFFEEDGVFKAGNVMKKDGTAYQVELPTGRRTKVKGGDNSEKLSSTPLILTIA